MMLPSRRAVLAFAALAMPVRALAAPVPAASAWVDGHRSRVRLLDAGRDDGALLAALEIELHPGFKTYWRTPGDSGVPPTFDWAASANVAAVEPLWPAPTRFEDAGGVSYGYHDRLVLPLRVRLREAGRPARLAGAVDYGVCNDICIPARAEVALELSGKGPLPAAVAQALARVPAPHPIDGDGPLAILAVAPQPGAKLLVSVRAPQGSTPTLFPEAPDNWYLAAGAVVEAGSAGAARRGTFTVEVAQRPRDAAGPVDLRFTLAAGERAVESVLRLDAADLAR
jgi:DsbC/DsbD-like thiol-disulfide interchange protein